MADNKLFTTKTGRKKLGIGSLSLLLVIAAFFWSFNIYEFCLGDTILTALHLPTWSQNSGVRYHYTVYYSFIFLIPAVILSDRREKDLFAVAGKWLSLTFILLLLIIIFL